MNMDLTSQSPVEVNKNDAVSTVDPFLVEALQNPRHRLTILRMELDIQKFMQNSDLLQFEFPHFPTSYLRLAAHRVAQHYGLQTMVHAEVGILVIKMAESKFPTVCLSDVPAKDSENDKLGQMKVVIRSRPKASTDDANKLGLKHSQTRSVEERKEEYDRARARIFSNSSSPERENALASDGRNLNVDEIEVSRNLGLVEDKFGGASTVAIFRDREKDLTDPDYDRRYERYVKNNPSVHSFSPSPAHFNMQNFQPQFVQYDSVFPGQMTAPQASLNYRSPLMSPYCAFGLNQSSSDAFYMQWPTQSMMYAQSYDQLRHTVFQAPFCQQPLSFDYSHSHL